MSVAADPWSDLLEGEEVSYVGEEPARPPRFAPIPEGLHPKVTDALAARGIEQLFTHQADAWDAAQRGEHLVVATGTASGKTLAFNLPVLDALARQPKTRALYLYPTKALAQDQIRSLTELKPPAIKPAIYDGDTESSRRWQIRKWSNLILTNPDMLHVGVLPHHDRWGDVLHNLRYVVVDEAHVYRGVFGSHVGNVLRRLRRLARIYGADPQFLLASATIANPGELAQRLIGVEATTIEHDGAPKAERTILLWNPPLTDEELGLRASALGEAARLMASLVERGVRTLCFAKSRKSAELVHRFTAQRLGDATRLSPYRAGYTPAQRREIERRLVEGDLLGVSATNALELGIDVGLLDAVDLRRLPGNRREPQAAVGPRRAPRPRARRDGRHRGRTRPVLHARPGVAARPAGRGGDPRPREPACPRRPCPLGRLRGAARREGRRDSRLRGARARGAASGSPPQGRRASSGQDGTTRPAASASARRRRTPSPSWTSRPGHSWGSSSRSAPTRPSTRAPSTSISASRTAWPSSTWRIAPPSSSRTPATSTRRRRRTR